MPWKRKKEHDTEKIIDSSIDILSHDEVIVNWMDNKEDSSDKFRSYVLLLEGKPNRFFPLSKNRLKLKFGRPSKLVYNYQINKLDRLWNYYSGTERMEVPVPYLYKLKKESLINTTPKLHKTENDISILSIYSPVTQSAVINYISIENIGKQTKRELKEGINLLRISENLESVRRISIEFSSSQRIEELNLIN